MIKPFTFLLGLLLISPASAQQQAPTPEIRAYTSRLLEEINKTLTCSVQTFELFDKIAKLEAELSELKKKEPKP